MTAQIDEIIKSFTGKLRKCLEGKILGVYLFGSVTKGMSTPESDIDMLVVYSGIDEWSLLKTTSEISFKIACKYGRLIETIPMSKQEFEKSLGRSPFLWEVLKFGKPVYTTLTGTEWHLDFKEYLILAKEFLGYAKDALREEKVRLAIDTGYNATELLVKALIINTKNSLVASHGGVVSQFGKLFVLTKEMSPEFGRNLNLCLELRAGARYKPKAKLSSKDAKFVINYAEKLLCFAEKRLVYPRLSKD